MTRGPLGRQQGERSIRVFVSSTFQDMQAEREELVKRVFPQLRKLCDARGVTWGEVDLRWGITDEQKAEGKVLPVCLAEIQRCRPYFIGLLGERYGWVPEGIPEDLIEQEPWLGQHLDCSVTELEILHGVLADPEMAEHAYFYLRDPGYVDSLPEEECSRYRETSEKTAGKLQALKQRIRASGFPVREGYSDPRTLGQMVLTDFSLLIDRLFPEGSALDPLDREAAEHEAFARSRTGVYVGRQAYFDRLNDHADGDGPPLVVVGESGSGKSALLANWAFGWRHSHPNNLVLMHFVGSSAHSSNWREMLRRVMGELSRHLGVVQETPDQPDRLRLAFANSLHMASAKGRVVLVLDGLDQLEDREGALELLWLPPEIPPNVRLAVSTLPGRSLEVLKGYWWPTVTVEPLEPGERDRLISAHLAQYAKALSPDRAQRIGTAPQTANPLFLRTLLEELRVFGAHEGLDERIDHYLAADTLDRLYRQILERYEKDYEEDRPGLVGEAMALLWGARRGLSEAELLDLLGGEGESLPMAIWSPLHLALEQSLVNRAGLISFSACHLRRAVGDKYLSASHERDETHLRLASFFGARHLAPRGLDEYPWQLAEARAWPRLSDLLADPEFLAAAWHANRFGVMTYWASIEEASPLRLVDAYRPALDQLAGQPLAFLAVLSSLLRETGHPSDALAVLVSLVARSRELGDRALLAAALDSQAAILGDRGEPDAALLLLKEEEQIFRQLGDRAGLGVCLANQAGKHLSSGELDAAVALYQQAEQIFRELGDRRSLRSVLFPQAGILLERGHSDEAMALSREADLICRELGDRAELRLSLGFRSTLLQRKGDFRGALALEQEEGQICRELGDRWGVGVSLIGQAGLLRGMEEKDAALACCREATEIFRQLGSQTGLGMSLGAQAGILRERGELDAALALHREEGQILRQLGNKAGLGLSLVRQAAILQSQGDLNTALTLYREAEPVFRQLGDQTELALCLTRQGGILRDQGELDAALTAHREAEGIWRESTGIELGISLTEQASILRDQGELDAALARYMEAERYYRDIGEKAFASIALSGQAAVLQDRGELEAALARREEAKEASQEADQELQAMFDSQFGPPWYHPATTLHEPRWPERVDRVSWDTVVPDGAVWIRVKLWGGGWRGVVLDHATLDDLDDWDEARTELARSNAVLLVIPCVLPGSEFAVGEELDISSGEAGLTLVSPTTLTAVTLSPQESEDLRVPNGYTGRGLIIGDWEAQKGLGRAGITVLIATTVRLVWRPSRGDPGWKQFSDARLALKADKWPARRRELESGVERATSPFDRHLALGEMMKEAYGLRDQHPDALADAISAARQAIAMSPEAAQDWLARCGPPLPGHWPFQQLIIIYEKQKDYPSALSLVDEAETQGWGGDWQWRRTRLLRKIEKRDRAERKQDRTRRTPSQETRSAAGSPDHATSPEVRRWARDRGLSVTSRGRLPLDLISAWDAEHPDRPYGNE